jgi:hypothetical protein
MVWCHIVEFRTPPPLNSLRSRYFDRRARTRLNACNAMRHSSAVLLAPSSDRCRNHEASRVIPEVAAWAKAFVASRSTARIHPSGRARRKRARQRLALNNPRHAPTMFKPRQRSPTRRPPLPARVAHTRAESVRGDRARSSAQSTSGGLKSRIRMWRHLPQHAGSIRRRRCRRPLSFSSFFSSPARCFSPAGVLGTRCFSAGVWGGMPRSPPPAHHRRLDAALAGRVITNEGSEGTTAAMGGRCASAWGHDYLRRSAFGRLVGERKLLLVRRLSLGLTSTRTSGPGEALQTGRRAVALIWEEGGGRDPAPPPAVALLLPRAPRRGELPAASRSLRDPAGDRWSRTTRDASAL